MTIECLFLDKFSKDLKKDQDRPKPKLLENKSYYEVNYGSCLYDHHFVTYYIDKEFIEYGRHIEVLNSKNSDIKFSY